MYLTIAARAAARVAKSAPRHASAAIEQTAGTGNMELHLDRRMAERRIWPAIDIDRSGTRREELLLSADDLRRVWLLRNVLSDRKPTEAMEMLTTQLKRTRSNVEFLDSFSW